MYTSGIAAFINIYVGVKNQISRWQGLCPYLAMGSVVVHRRWTDPSDRLSEALTRRVLGFHTSGNIVIIGYFHHLSLFNSIAGQHGDEPG